MISRSYNTIYSKSEIMEKRLCFSSAMITFSPMKLICSLNAPKNHPIDIAVFTDEQISEIESHLKSYTEAPYVIEAKGDIYVVLPSIYPTSSMCIILRMDFAPSVFLRFLRDKADLFVLSPNINIQASRMTKRLDALKKEFLDFCNDVEHAFLQMNRYNLIFDENDLKNGYCEELEFLSRFLAVPIDEIVINDSDDEIPIKSNFALFVAFSSCMMMLAKNDALDRSIKFELDFMGGTLTVNTSFKTDKKMKVTNETFLWDYLASDKRMLFEYYDEDNRFCVNFRPHFIDWSYLEMKQDLSVKTLFEERED